MLKNISAEDDDCCPDLDCTDDPMSGCDPAPVSWGKNDEGGAPRATMARAASEDAKSSEDSKFGKYVQWTSGDGTNFFPASETIERLIPAVYEVDHSQTRGYFFKKIAVRKEGIIRFPDTTSDRVIAEIQKFWDREEYFEKYKLIYKRGILLYGPPGSGKSCTIHLIMEDVIKRGGIVVNFRHPNMFLEGMRILREIQPETPVVAIMEDLDSIIQMYCESDVLNLLDGVNEVNRIVFLATTNYPEKLGGRIVNRPSRFDKRFRIGTPNAACRKMYFEHIISQGASDPNVIAARVKEHGIDLDQWVKDTARLSMAHLKELFVQVIIIGDPYAMAIKTLRNMKEVLEDKSEDATGIGFKHKSIMDDEDDCMVGCG